MMVEIKVLILARLLARNSPIRALPLSAFPNLGPAHRSSLPAYEWGILVLALRTNKWSNKIVWPPWVHRVNWFGIRGIRIQGLKAFDWSSNISVQMRSWDTHFTWENGGSLLRTNGKHRLSYPCSVRRNLIRIVG